MSYRTIGGIDDVLTKIGAGAAKVTETISTFEQIKAAASGKPVAPAAESSSSSVLPTVAVVGGLGLVAWFFLRKKK